MFTKSDKSGRAPLRACLCIHSEQNYKSLHIHHQNPLFAPRFFLRSTIPVSCRGSIVLVLKNK